MSNISSSILEKFAGLYCIGAPLWIIIRESIEHTTVCSMNVHGMFNIRKIVKNGRGSYYINIPKDIFKELRWRERQKLIVEKKGKTLIIRDWPAPRDRGRKKKK